jgi:hypothetical protein
MEVMTVISKDKEIIENALRLLAKAQSMSPPVAAEYLSPLTFLNERHQQPEAANAVAAVSTLIASLRTDAETNPDNWGSAVKALQAWQDALND